MEDWKTVRWSLLDDESGQGTFVNQTRLERGQPLTLNADDLIGLGSGDSASSRTGGLETFVYRLKPPAAFQDLVSTPRTVSSDVKFVILFCPGDLCRSGYCG